MTTSENVINFRFNLIQALKEKGFSVSIVANDEQRREEIISLGVDFYCIENSNRSVSVLKANSYRKRLQRLIEKIGPDVVFTFQAKPNTFGVLAAKKAGVKRIFSMVEGAGDVFTKKGLKWNAIRAIVCHLYRKAFKYSNKVFFLNDDDKSEFIERRLVKEEQCELINGIGVDLRRFSFKPIKNDRTFIMIARMLKTKGVFEYCECAKIVKQKYPDAVFNYLGSEGDVSVDNISMYIEDGTINYLGTTKDVRPYIEDALMLLLCSYREGMPMSIMEAQAMGRGIITSNNVGCRDTVVDGYNGFLVEHKNVEMMANKCIYAIEHFDEMVIMGQNARKFAEEHFDSVLINSKVVAFLNESVASIGE